MVFGGVDAIFNTQRKLFDEAWIRIQFLQQGLFFPARPSWLSTWSSNLCPVSQSCFLHEQWKCLKLQLLCLEFHKCLLCAETFTAWGEKKICVCLFVLTVGNAKIIHKLFLDTTVPKLKGLALNFGSWDDGNEHEGNEWAWLLRYLTSVLHPVTIHKVHIVCSYIALALCFYPHLFFLFIFIAITI